MLHGLDAVDWSRLRHAYGPADDVPELLRALIAAPGDFDPGDESHPIWQLHGNIWHQGDVYPATAKAVPFLVELALAKVPAWVHILSLLGDIATAEPAGQCGEAIAAAAPVLLPFLQDVDPIGRVATGYVLSSIKPPNSAVLSALRNAAEVERDATAKTGFVLCMGRSGDSSGESLAILQKALATRRRCLRAASAISLVKLMGQQSPANARTVLAGLIEADWYDECFADLPWDVYAEIDVDEMLSEVGGAPASLAIERRLGLLLNPKAEDVGFIVQELIRLSFRLQQARRSEVPELDDLQRRVLRSIVRCDEAWQNSALFLGFLHDVGLPLVRWRLAELAGESLRFPRPSLLTPDGRHRHRLSGRPTLSRRVYHVLYGAGTVTHVDETHLSVQFDKEGSHHFDPRIAEFFSEDEDPV